MPLSLAVPAAGFGYFFAHVMGVIASDFRRIFLGRYGRRHRLTGIAYLMWLLLGYADLFVLGGVMPRLTYNVVFSVLGILLTLSAAFDFRHHHSRVKNVASGTMDEDATVTFDEMLEHAFYHWLNLFQIVFLHLVTAPPPGMPLLSRRARIALVVAATSPWLVRSWFPVNPFSANYDKQRTGRDPLTLIAVLYRLKKYQYMVYKHFLLHGLNLTVAFRAPPVEPGAPGLAEQPSFQLYWLALNTAYVMEFFLQTLVKRRFMRQSTMLALNQLLMAVSTLVAVQVLLAVDLRVAAASLALNMVHRSRPWGEMLNFGMMMALSAAVIA